jgi:hypothetical protein
MMKRYACSGDAKGDSRGDAGKTRVPLAGGFCRRAEAASLLSPGAGTRNRFAPLSWALEVESGEELEVDDGEEIWSPSGAVEEELAARPDPVKLGCFIDWEWGSSPQVSPVSLTASVMAVGSPQVPSAADFPPLCGARAPAGEGTGACRDGVQYLLRQGSPVVVPGSIRVGDVVVALSPAAAVLDKSQTYL